MYNLIIAIVAGAVTTVAFGFIIGGGDFRPLYGIVPGVIALVGVYIWLARRSLKQVQALVEQAQGELQNQNVDRAVALLKEGYPLAKWQFLVQSNIDGHIGTILYMSKRFDQAENYLKRAFSKNWVAGAMLGALYYKRKDYDQMKAAFEDAVQSNKKEALLWNLYAYCLWKSKQREEAIEVLNRALEKMPDHERTKSNLNALQNNRKMKMRSWNMMWYQFHLDRPPMQQQRTQFRR